MKRAGGGLRFPTEAEWEYACRAGSATEYCFGDDPKGLEEHAWYAGNCEGTHPVGEKPPNRWGLCDVHGNVWEWCADWYDEKAYSKSASSDPAGPSSGDHCVLRGGSCLNGPRYCRSAFRYRHFRSFAHCGHAEHLFGLRVVRGL